MCFEGPSWIETLKRRWALRRCCKGIFRKRTGLLLMLTMLFLPGAVIGEGNPDQVRCDVHQGPCVADLHGTGVALDIQPKPVKAMRDLTFTLSLKGAKTAGEPYIDLGMPGMNMGPNRVKLKPGDQGVFQGKGIIVRCPSGRRTWK